MLRRSVLLVAMAAILAFPIIGRAQQGSPPPDVPASADTRVGSGYQHGHEKDKDLGTGNQAGRGHGRGHGGGRHGMMQKCSQMKEKSDKAMDEIKAMDDRLDEKLAAVTKATGDQKVAAMEAMLVELASQRKAMREKLGHMHHHQAMCGMMGKRGRHGKMMHGGTMGKCPMMDEMQQGSEVQGREDDAQAKPEAKR